MPSDTVTRIIKSAYGKKYNLDSYALTPKPLYYPVVRDYISRLPSMLYFFRSQGLHIAAVVLTLLVGIMTAYYYNLLVVSEQQVLTAQGKVSVLMQRRNDISINLSKAVLDYSRHERDVFTGVVALRTLLSGGDKAEKAFKKKQGAVEPPTAMPPGSSAKSSIIGDPASVVSAASVLPVSSVLPLSSVSPVPPVPQAKLMGIDQGSLASLGKQLLAVAEQYPDLKLSVSFGSLMTALIDVEKDLAAERQKFNDAVNTYTTNVIKFPSNIYAALFEFSPQSYFEATQDAKQLVPITY